MEIKKWRRVTCFVDVTNWDNYRRLLLFAKNDDIMSWAYCM